LAERGESGEGANAALRVDGLFNVSLDLSSFYFVGLPTLRRGYLPLFFPFSAQAVSCGRLALTEETAGKSDFHFTVKFDPKPSFSGGCGGQLCAVLQVAYSHEVKFPRCF